MIVGIVKFFFNISEGSSEFDSDQLTDYEEPQEKKKSKKAVNPRPKVDPDKQKAASWKKDLMEFNVDFGDSESDLDMENQSKLVHYYNFEFKIVFFCYLIFVIFYRKKLKQNFEYKSPFDMENKK